MSFSYEEFTTRNLGFVDAAAQKKLREATVFVCGTGGWAARPCWRWHGPGSGG